MERRELIKMIAMATGATMLGAEFFLAGCKNPEALAGTAFTKEDIAFLDEVGDTILPATKTPGAKAAQIGKFMAKMVNDTYSESNQQIFRKGMNTLNEACKKTFGKLLVDSNAGQRTSLLTGLDKEAKAYQQTKKADDPLHYFTMMKQLTLLGYFTSKIGVTEALRYLPVPGRYDGDVVYKKGDKAWATS